MQCSHILAFMLQMTCCPLHTIDSCLEHHDSSLGSHCTSWSQLRSKVNLDLVLSNSVSAVYCIKHLALQVQQHLEGVRAVVSCVLPTSQVTICDAMQCRYTILEMGSLSKQLTRQWLRGCGRRFRLSEHHCPRLIGCGAEVSANRNHFCLLYGMFISDSAHGNISLKWTLELRQQYSHHLLPCSWF